MKRLLEWVIYQAVLPPSTAKFCPVMYWAAWVARKTAALAAYRTNQRTAN